MCTPEVSPLVLGKLNVPLPYVVRLTDLHQVHPPGGFADEAIALGAGNQLRAVPRVIPYRSAQ